MDENTNWKKGPVYLVGGLLGAVAGFVSAYLYTRTAEENTPGTPPARITTGDLFKLSLAAITLIRQISDLGLRKSNKGK